MSSELEYNISAKIAEIIKDYKDEYNYIELGFVKKVYNKIPQ